MDAGGPRGTGADGQQGEDRNDRPTLGYWLFACSSRVSIHSIPRERKVAQPWGSLRGGLGTWFGSTLLSRDCGDGTVVDIGTVMTWAKKWPTEPGGKHDDAR